MIGQFIPQLFISKILGSQAFNPTSITWVRFPACEEFFTLLLYFFFDVLSQTYLILQITFKTRVKIPSMQSSARSSYSRLLLRLHLRFVATQAIGAATICVK